MKYILIMLVLASCTNPIDKNLQERLEGCEFDKRQAIRSMWEARDNEMIAERLAAYQVKELEGLRNDIKHNRESSFAYYQNEIARLNAVVDSCLRPKQNLSAQPRPKNVKFDIYRIIMDNNNN